MRTLCTPPLRSTLKATCATPLSRARFGRIALVAFEPGDQLRLPVRQRVGIARRRAGRRRRGAVGAAARPRSARWSRLLAFASGFFSFGFSSGFGGGTHFQSRPCGASGSSTFSIGFSGCGSGSASVCSHRVGRHVGRRGLGRDRDRREIDHDHRRIRHQVGILVPLRQQRGRAGGMKAQRERKADAPAQRFGPAPTRCRARVHGSCPLPGRPARHADSRRCAARSSAPSARHRARSCRRAGTRAAACRRRSPGRARR